MLKLVSIAVRNVFRNTRRTALTLTVVSFGVASLLLAGGFCAYNYDGLRETTIRNGIGHLQLFTAAYLDDGEEHPLGEGITGYQELQAWLEEQEHVAVTSAQVRFVGLLSNGDKSEPFLGAGVDVHREGLMGFSLNVRDGESLYEEDGHQVLLGTGLAESLGLTVGNLVTLMVTTTDGALNAIDAEVVGLYSTGVREMDARSLRMPLATAQQLLDSDRVTKVLVKLEATRYTEEVAASLASAGLRAGGQELRVRTWEELAPFYKQVVALYNSIFLFVGLIIAVLVVLSTANTMMMAVFERVREIGTLMALGTRRRQILGIFVLEGMAIGVLGGALGCLLSWGLIEVINGAGITMPPPPSFSRGIPLLIKLVPELFLFVFVLVVGLQTVSAVLPALRGARMRIVDALGHV
jgi:putative ABC transport system permease protein